MLMRKIDVEGVLDCTGVWRTSIVGVGSICYLYLACVMSFALSSYSTGSLKSCGVFLYNYVTWKGVMKTVGLTNMRVG